MEIKFRPKEKEVIELVLEACDNKEIAKKMNITLSTVHKHLNSLYRKHGLQDFTGHKKVKLAMMLYKERNEDVSSL